MGQLNKRLQSLATRKGTVDESIYVRKIFPLNEAPCNLYLCHEEEFSCMDIV